MTQDINSTSMTGNKACELTVVLPCLNEAETIEQCVAVAAKMLNDNQIDGEIVVGDNGSTDGSQDLARRAGARVVDVPQRGYGAALMGAIEAARGRYIVMGDADMSYDFGEAPKFLEKLREGYDLVMGNRFQGGIRKGAMPFKNRWLGNPVLTGVGRAIYKAPVGDFHSGMRGFSAEAYRQMGVRTAGMEFASEMVVKATVLKMRMTEVPIVLYPDGRSRPPHLKPWRDGWRHLRFLLLFSPRWALVYPGGVLAGAGLIVAFAAIVGLGGRVTLGVHSLAAAGFMVIVGYTAVTIGIGARIYALQGQLGPPSSKALQKAFDSVSLEKGLLAGGVVLLAGMAIAAWVLRQWWIADWGPLPETSTIKAMLVGGFLIAIGAQTILMSLFYSMLGINMRAK